MAIKRDDFPMAPGCLRLANRFAPPWQWHGKAVDLPGCGCLGRDLWRFKMNILTWNHGFSCPNKMGVSCRFSLQPILGDQRSGHLTTTCAWPSPPKGESGGIRFLSILICDTGDVRRLRGYLVGVSILYLCEDIRNNCWEENSAYINMYICINYIYIPSGNLT